MVNLQSPALVAPRTAIWIYSCRYQLNDPYSLVPALPLGLTGLEALPIGTGWIAEYTKTKHTRLLAFPHHLFLPLLFPRQLHHALYPVAFQVIFRQKAAARVVQFGQVVFKVFALDRQHSITAHNASASGPVRAAKWMRKVGCMDMPDCYPASEAPLPPAP